MLLLYSIAMLFSGQIHTTAHFCHDLTITAEHFKTSGQSNMTKRAHRCRNGRASVHY